MSAESWGEITLTVAFVALLVWRGFWAPLGSLLSWPMFSHICCYRVHLTDDETGEPVGIWDYELPQDHFRPPQDLIGLVAYLQEAQGITASGEGVLAVPFAYWRIEVTSGRVVYRPVP